MKEYKIIKAKYDINFEKAEAIMNEMSKEGWEVVSVSPETSLSLSVIITFQREIESDKNS